MSHGKTVWLKGTTKNMIDINGKKMSFNAEAEVGVAYTHGKIAGDATKAEKEIVDEINFKIDKEWKKQKAQGESPEIDKTDLEFDTFSRK